MFLISLLAMIEPMSSVFQGQQVFIDPEYNLNKRPNDQMGKAVQVNASINIRNILDVDEKSQLVTLETTIRLYWKDDRIQTKDEFLESHDSFGYYTTLHPSLADKIWMPDIFIDQVKTLRVPSFLIKPASLRVYNDSLIRYSSRVNFDVACNMNFHWYPHDSQICIIKLESFGFQSAQMNLNWLPGSQGLTYNSNISLAQFNASVKLLDAYATDYYDVSYPGLIIQLTLVREIGYHIVQTYVPSSVFVILAWFSLFIPAESVPGRVGMTMTTMLTLTAMFSAVRASVPRISYISALDVWMLICILLVFSTVIEFIVITVLNKYGKKREGERFERVCLVLLPVLFILITLVYWAILLN